MNICKDCKHARRGEAIDLREISTAEYRAKCRAEDRVAPSPMRPGLRRGDYICSLVQYGPSPVDPVTGFQALPRGGDCRDLNPAGECEKFTRAGLLARFLR